MIIFDFDHTLFDTQKLKKELAKAFGISLALYSKTYNELFRKQGKITDYDFKKHLVLLGKSDKLAAEKANAILKRLDMFLKPGALKLLEELKKRKIKLVLLTAGNIAWQKRKINNSRIKKYFNKIIYVKNDKLSALSKLPISKKKILFINDNLIESEKIKKKFKSKCDIFIIKSFHSCKNNKKFKYFSNLNQIYNYLLNNNL